MKYRGEIDGFRAVAVLPVMLFHADFPLFSGGFVGVDIFFVISGYLITTIIAEELEQGGFSIADFYERRARRILPALFFVMAVCLPFAWMWMLPQQLLEFSHSLIAVSLFISNVLFWKESGYFATAAEEKPLLHTWSLAVEEQYYLFFPILMIVLWRFRKDWALSTLVALSLVSLAISEWGWRNDPTANFYLSPPRVWELFAGSLCALLIKKRGQGENNVLAGLGLMVVVYALFAYDRSTPFPSVFALLPVSGACLVILFGTGGTIVAKLLSSRAIVGLGLVSYGTYLWHQPLFAFTRIRFDPHPTVAVSLGLILFSIAMGAVSRRFVEQPFRNRKSGGLSRRSIAVFSAAGLLAFGAIGFSGHMLDGSPERFTGTPAGQTLEVGRVRAFDCKTNGYKSCVIGAKDQDPVAAVIGDSHTGRYAYGFDEILKGAGRSMLYSGAPWCAPLLEFTTRDSSKNNDICRNNMSRELVEISKSNSIHTVILASEWGNYTQGFRPGSTLSAYAYQNSGNDDPSKNPAEFERALAATVRLLLGAGKKVVLVESIPEYGFHITNRLAQLQWNGGDPGTLDLPVDEFQARNQKLFEILAKPAFSEVRRVNVAQFFCDASVCRPYSEDGLPLYNDGIHLAGEGLKRVVSTILSEAGVIGD